MNAAPPTVLFCSSIDDADTWRSLFARERPDVAFRVWPEIGDAAEITHALVFNPPAGLLASLPSLRAVFALGAGVDQILEDVSYPSAVPLFRLVDAGLGRQMTEYALYGVLHRHRDMERYRSQKASSEWRMRPAVLAEDRRVGVMGFGVFGAGIARTLAGLGFRVAGWRRGGSGAADPALPDVEMFCGPEALEAFLARIEILINVLPLTDETRGILSAPLFSSLPEGSALIHLGRGGHLVEADLLAALEDGRVDWAMLDVFPQEPLPAGHPFWAHPKVMVTPHVAAQPVGDEAERQILTAFSVFEAGGTPGGRVDLQVGY